MLTIQKHTNNPRVVIAFVIHHRLGYMTQNDGRISQSPTQNFTPLGHVSDAALMLWRI